MTESIEPIEVWRAFVETWKVWKRGVDRNLERMGLNSTEYSILRHLKEEGKMPMVQMANLIMVTQGWITGLIDSMEERHLVRRERIPTDRRVIELNITDEGVDLYNKAREVHISYIQKTLACMNPETLKNTLSAIKGLRKNIDEYKEQNEELEQK